MDSPDKLDSKPCEPTPACDTALQSYDNTEFFVPWQQLRQFLAWPQDDNGAIGGIALLIKHITIQISLRNPTQSLAEELRLLLSLVNAERITIEILGTGALDGSDMDTQIVMRSIAVVVEYLYQCFGDKFTIRKKAGPWGHRPDGLLLSYGKSVDLTSYWYAPSIEAINRFYYGQTTFEEAMQVNIQTWLPDWLVLSRPVAYFSSNAQPFSKTEPESTVNQ